MKLIIGLMLLSAQAIALRPDSHSGQSYLSYPIWSHGSGRRVIDIYTYKTDLQTLPALQFLQETGMECDFASIARHYPQDSSIDKTYDVWKVTINYQSAKSGDQCWAHMQHPDYTKGLALQFYVVD